MLNENIKAIRKSKGLSQQDLADKLNVVRQTTLNHAMRPERRGDMRPAPIHIGKRVWSGANAAERPGVSPVSRNLS